MPLTTKTLFPTVLLAAMTMTACSFDVDFDSDSDDETSRRTERDTIAADGITTVDIRTNDGSVTVSTSDVGNVTEDGAGIEIDLTTELRHAGNGRAGHTIETDGDTVTIDGFCSSGLSRCSVAFDVIVPEGVDVNVITDDGSISFDAVDGDVSARSDDGAIFATALRASSVEVQSDDGSIDLDFGLEPERVNATTDDGSITISLPKSIATYDVSTSVDDGSVNLDITDDNSSDRTIDVAAEDGSISINAR